MKKWIALLCYGLPAIIFANTGPEYLEDDKEQNPLHSGFVLFKLPFIENRINHVHLRSFYQNRDFDASSDHEDLAGGGELNVVGSYWASRIKLALTGYSSQKLFADDSKTDTGALQSGHQSYSALGEAYGSLTLDNLAIQAGRYAVNLPYVNKSDIRMIPQTFQGAHAVYTVSHAWTVGGGVLSDIKARTRTGFDSMYEKAGLNEDESVYIAGALYEKDSGTGLGLYTFHAPDFHDGVYVELNERFLLSLDNYIQLSGQYTRQESVGDELGGNFTVDHYGARLTWEKSWYSTSIAFTDYPEEDRILSPWGSIPGYTSIMINDFDRQQESAWLLGGSVDLARIGASGFSANTKYVVGDTPDCGLNASPDRDEMNLNLKYAPPMTTLAGLILELRFGWAWEAETCADDDDEDITEIRFVTNYSLDF